MLCSLLAALSAAAEHSVDLAPRFMAEIDWRTPTSLAITAALDDEAAAHQDVAAQARGYPWRGTLPAEPDWRGARRDAGYFSAYQFVAVGLLYLAPEDISGWDEEAKQEYSLDKWVDNVTDPVFRDGDVWWINYILHPYWGGAYYIRGRQRGLDETRSFLYSALLSTMYEYGIEALFEPVSIEDMIITPVVGFFVGEYLFTPLRDYVRAKPGELAWSDKAILALTDPLGVANAGIDRLFGIKSTLQAQPIGNPAATLAAGPDMAGLSPASLRNYDPAWGLQVRIDW